MSSTTKDDSKAGKASMSAGLKMALTGGGVAIFIAVGVFLMMQFATSERDREMRQWQSRMSIVIDSRYTDINRWIDRQLADLRGIADNASVQLYLTVFHESGTSASADDAPPELGYLGNLLEVVGERAGFKSDVQGPQVNANVQKAGVAGLALIDMDNFIIVSSSGFPPLQGPVRAFLEQAERGVTSVSDVFINERGNSAMAFLVPVYAVQADESAESQLGYVVGVKEIADELYPLLEQPGATEETAETMIVRQNGNKIEYLTPRADGTAPLQKSLAADTPNLASAWAVRTVGGFATVTDYAGNEVLAISRAFNQVPWTLVYKVDTAEALKESEDRLQLLMIVFGVIIILVLIGMLALWYYGTSQRATEAAAKFEELANRFQGQRNFMHTVTDSQPNSIVILDENGHYRWFNKTALQLSRMDRSDMFDKHVSAILGPIEGKRIHAWVKEALAKNERLTVTHEMELGNDGPKVYRTDFQPLPAREDFPPGVLMVSQDITESVLEREKRETVMRQLVGTLVSVVDRRDPFSANHSVRVGEVSRAVAQEMQAERVMMETAAIAGSLMNLGKITVPEELLTKQGKLTDEEVRMIQESVLTSAELVSKIDFDGPVYDTLRHLQEHYDGTGTPDGLAGKDIVITARIAAVANAFVGMVSARAWRSGMSVDKALDILLADGNKKYDRAVVVALANYLDNRGGREEWASYGEAPTETGA
ncbi:MULTISPECIES: HD domain-containing phosphohydrolase [unclassified Hwanghaeella]|uniref:HD domain-containing phosphohydrolase n=1 Tax=unclassified Hwanghaeella TaxID=2605944 RepID=UPI003B685E25